MKPRRVDCLSVLMLVFGTFKVLIGAEQLSSNSDHTNSGVSRCLPTDGCYEYVTYHPGSPTGWPPVILSAPHSGILSPASIPDRLAGCWDQNSSQCVWSHDCGATNITACRAVKEDDYETHDLAQQIHHHLCKLFHGRCPAIIFNNLARVKFDANRDKPEATFGVPIVAAAFDEYNGHIERSKETIVSQHGAGLFIDVHGQGHRIQRAELGYLLRADVLDSEEMLDDPSLSSIRSLSSRHPDVSFDDLVRGDASFGAFLERFGYQSVPSASNKGPGVDNPYFNGGYLTRRHGSRDHGTVDAIQIESARSVREPSHLRHYARSVAHAIHQYVCHYYVMPGNQTSHAETIAIDCHAGAANGQQRLDPSRLSNVALIVCLLIAMNIA